MASSTHAQIKAKLAQLFYDIRVDHLSLDELDYELIVRDITFSENEAMSRKRRALREILKVERGQDSVVKSFKGDPVIEFELCVQKFNQIEQSIITAPRNLAPRCQSVLLHLGNRLSLLDNFLNDVDQRNSHKMQGKILEWLNSLCYEKRSVIHDVEESVGNLFDESNAIPWTETDNQLTHNRLENPGRPSQSSGEINEAVARQIEYENVARPSQSATDNNEYGIRQSAGRNPVVPSQSTVVESDKRVSITDNQQNSVQPSQLTENNESGYTVPPVENSVRPSQSSENRNEYNAQFSVENMNRPSQSIEEKDIACSLVRLGLLNPENAQNVSLGNVKEALITLEHELYLLRRFKQIHSNVENNDALSQSQAVQNFQSQYTRVDTAPSQFRLREVDRSGYLPVSQEPSNNVANSSEINYSSHRNVNAGSTQRCFPSYDNIPVPESSYPRISFTTQPVVLSSQPRFATSECLNCGEADHALENCRMYRGSLC